MNSVRIKQMQKLEKALMSDSYEVRINLDAVRNKLLFFIKLKEGDDRQILAEWGNARTIRPV